AGEEGRPAAHDMLREYRPQHQKPSLRPNWMMRGARALVTRPNAPDPKVVLMPLKLAWLKMLKNSALNCRFTDSVMRLFLKKDMSHLWVPGSRMMLRPALPKKPGAGSAKAAVLNHCWTVLAPSTSPTRFGLVARPFRPVEMPGAATGPLETVVMPEISHPPKIRPTASRRFLKKGSS